jgi:hypothetical protein
MSEAGSHAASGGITHALSQPRGNVILLKIAGHYVDRLRLRELLVGLLANEGKDSMHFCHAESSPETYVYCQAPAGDEAKAQADTARIQAALDAAFESAQAILLQVTQGIPGASAHASPQWHYVVETDVQPEAEDDFNDWYANEHLPGLASVPGTILAARLHDARGRPRYHALYLLETRDTFGSPPWLAVRATDWSSRVRPNFTNTKRTMFRIVPDTPERG